MLRVIDTKRQPLPGGREAWMLRPLHRAESHVFEHRENHILHDVAEGTFFHVDTVICDVLDLCEGRSVVDMLHLLQDRHGEKDVVSACRELYDAEVVTDRPVDYQPFTPPGRLEVVRLGLDVTYDGLDDAGRCSGGACSSGRGCPSNMYMSEKVALKAVDTLMAESGRIRQCHITFGGNEPLLNAPLVEKVIEYAVERGRDLGKEVSFEITTDRRLLNERVFRYLKRRNVRIILKVDGDDTAEESMFRGSGPYSLSHREFERNADGNGRADVHLRGIAGADVTGVAERISRDLTRYPSVHSVTLETGPLPQGCREALTAGAAADLEGLADFVKAHLLNGGEAWIGDIEDHMAQVFATGMSFYHCGAGTRALTVAPDGKLYVCPGTVGNGAFSVGHVNEGIDREKQKAWIKSTHVEEFEACGACWARYLCGGGCRLNSFLESGRVESPSPAACGVIRRTYELAMSTCLQIAEEDSELLETRYGEAS